MDNQTRPQLDVAESSRKRKIRKGTRSCWECKRRKVRCMPCNDSDVACIECQRRGATCISQDLPVPDDTSQSPDKHAQMTERMERVERLLERLSQDVVALRDGIVPQSNPAEASLNQPVLHKDTTTHYSEVEPGLAGHLSGNEPSVTPEILQVPQNHVADSVSDPSYASKIRRISGALHASLPSAEDARLVSQCNGEIAIFFHQMLIRPYSDLDRDGFDSAEKLGVLPTLGTHPVLLARYMLMLAASLQCLHPDFQDEISGLSETPSALMKRLTNTVSSLVTADDEFMNSLEGIQCMMLEGIFQTNSGNLRSAWQIFRRAMKFARVMGINSTTCAPTVLDPETTANPQFIWFRIVQMDRYLCLMLGQSQSYLEHDFAGKSALANDTPMGRLERIHCVIASKILERNQRGLPSSHDRNKTREIDIEIQKLSQTMPSKWFLVPNMARLAKSSKDEEVFWEMLRLIDQIFHYSLINQLHLPYMLRASLDPMYIYNRVTCVTSSREVLTRFIVFRTFNRTALCYRPIDFFAVTSAMALVLAHINANQHAGDSFIAHQRTSDRAMVEQVIDIMQMATDLNTDALSRKSAHILYQLLAVEEKAAEGSTFSTKSVDVVESWPRRDPSSTERFVGTEAPNAYLNSDSSVLTISIAHFGNIKITREGRISTEPLLDKPRVNPDLEGRRKQRGSAGDSAQLSYFLNGPQPEFTPGTSVSTLDLRLDQDIEQDSQSLPTMQYRDPSYPDIAPDGNDWVFQGVDGAFFDSLMKGLIAQNDDIGLGEHDA